MAATAVVRDIASDRSGEICELTLRMIKSLVDDHSPVEVNVEPDAGGSTIHVKVAVGELGKVIGKSGRTARSLRTIIGAASMKHQHRYSLDIAS